MNRSRSSLMLRMLPVPGEVLVQVGQRVTPESVIAKAHVPGELLILPVSQRLGIQPNELSRSLRVTVGEKVEARRLIAVYRGLWGILEERVESPIAGVIEYISEKTGHVGIRSGGGDITVQAFVEGVVESVQENGGASIRTESSRIRGIFGVGGERWGILRGVAVAREEVIRSIHIPDACEGSVLFGGAGVTLGALRKATERGVQGLITGAIDDEVLAGFTGKELSVLVTGEEQVPFTLIVTEGFGIIPMAPETYEVFTEHISSRCSINGATQVRAGAVRPEIFLQGKTSEGGQIPYSELRIGSAVRIIRTPLMGITGEVVSLPSAPERLPSGVLTSVVELKINETESVRVARVNTEPLNY